MTGASQQKYFHGRELEKYEIIIQLKKYVLPEVESLV